MKKELLKVSLVLIVVAMGLVVYSIVAPSPVKDPTLYKKTGAIVRLVYDDHTFCTGTIVSDHLLVTAAHCAAAQQAFGMPIEVRGQDNTPVGVYASINYASPQVDQAILVGDFTRFEHKRLHTNPDFLTAFGTKDRVLTSCGYPLNGDLYCSQTVFKKRYAFFWEVEGVLMPGMSGGPTMLSDGSVVAVNVAVEGPDSVVAPTYNLDKNIRRSK